jgi:hypothetical protein
MQQPGRKSTAALSVVAGSIDGRPPAPDDLTAFQKEVWEKTAANEAADTFKTAALQQLLKEYCRHVDMAHWLEGQIQAARSGCELDDLNKLVRMRDCETKALADKATKLRLTNQSRYTPGAAGTAAKKATERKPWHAVS